MEKSADAFRTISEVADDLVLPQHVLRFWEKNFPQIRPLKRAGGRRYYRPADVVLLRSIRQLLHDEGYTIRGVQRLLKEQGARGLRVGEPVMLALVEDLHENTIDADPMVERLADDATGPLRLVSDDKPVAETPPAPEAGVVGTPGVLAETAALRDALACIEACERILSALRLPRDENSLQGRSASPITPEVGV